MEKDLIVVTYPEKMAHKVLISRSLKREGNNSHAPLIPNYINIMRLEVGE